MNESVLPLPVGSIVRFREDWLARCPPAEVKRFQNRTGTVTGYRHGAVEPIVTFARDGRRPEVKLFEVALKRIEVVPT